MANGVIYPGIECNGKKVLTKAWLPYSRYQSLSVVDGLSQSLEYLGRWELLPVVGGLSGSLTVFHQVVNGLSKSPFKLCFWRQTYCQSLAVAKKVFCFVSI